MCINSDKFNKKKLGSTRQDVHICVMQQEINKNLFELTIIYYVDIKPMSAFTFIQRYTYPYSFTIYILHN